MQLFYWSVWKLGELTIVHCCAVLIAFVTLAQPALSGSELMLFMILSPWFLSYPEISRFATSKNGQSVLRGIALGTALTAYALPTPLLRLFAVSIANVALWLEFGGTLSHLKGESAKSYGLSQCLIGTGLSVFADEHHYSHWMRPSFIAAIQAVELLQQPALVYCGC